MKRTPYQDLIESRHPRYLSRQSFWNLAWSSYIGGSDYLSASNLFSHRLENAEDHRRRLARAFYLNYCRPVVDTYGAYLFGVGPTVTPSETLGRLATDADGAGGALADVMRRQFTLAAIYGHALIGVDRPRSTAAPLTRAGEMEAGLRSYLYAVIPPDFLNWALDAGGGFAWCLVRERGDDASIETAAGADARTATVHRLWTREEWIAIDARGEEIDRGANPFGVVPFVPLRFRATDDPVVGESLLASIVDVNREIFNLGSLLSEILYRQTFSQLVAEGSAHEYGEEGDIARLGTSSIFLYPEGRRAPEFISPDSAQAELLMKRIDALIDEVYRLACLTRSSVREGAMASGISKAFDFLDTNQAMADAGAQVAASFERALAIASPGWSGRIQFPGDFGVGQADALLGETERALDLEIGPLFRRRLLERLARNFLRELPADQREDVIREIASGSRDDETRIPQNGEM